MPIDNPFRRPKRFQFPTKGVDLNSPTDQPKSQSKALQLKNMTVDQDGSLTVRPGLTNKYANAPLFGTKTPVHSAVRLAFPADPTASRYLYGAQDVLVGDLSGFLIEQISTGFSGKPLTFIPWRPSESNDSYGYVFDTSKQVKVAASSNANVRSIGIPRPTVPPTVELGPPSFGEALENVSGTNGYYSQVIWYKGSPTTSIVDDLEFTNEERFNNYTIVKAIPDTDTVGAYQGWNCYQVSDLKNLGPGLVLRFAGAAADATPTLLLVSEVYSGNSTINRVMYYIFDSGTSGLCTVMPEFSVAEIKRNALVSIAGITNPVRVLDVAYSSSGRVSFRCKLPSAPAVGASLTVLPCFRAYQYVNFDLTGAKASKVTGEATIDGIKLEMKDVADTKNGGVGYIQYNYGSPLDPGIDFTRFGVFSGESNVASDNDYFHISIKSNDLTKIAMIRVMFDIDSQFLDQNYYYYAIEQSALVQAAVGNVTPTDAVRSDRERVVITVPRVRPPGIGGTAGRIPGEFGPGRFGEQRGVVGGPLTEVDPDDPRKITIDRPVPGSGPAGANQWAEISWHRSEMFRVGSKKDASWRTVKAIRLEVTFTAPAHVVFHGVSIFGGGGPDIGSIGLPYQYRYRYRDSTTGAVSGYSPANRTGILPFRARSEVTLPTTTEPGVDYIDVERFGGQQDSWCLVGSLRNLPNASTVLHADSMTDFAALRNRPFSDRPVLQPWVRQLNALVGGNLVRSAGSVIELSSTEALSEKLLPGTLILLDGQPNIIRRPLGTGATRTKWELEYSHDSTLRDIISWHIPAPRYDGQPLGRVFGPYAGCLFACDGIYVRWTQGNDPDATREMNYAEVTDPTDVTIGGFVFNGRAGVLTTKRLLSVEGDPVNGFTFTEVPFGKGCASPYAIAVGPRVAWVGRDGVYESSGGEPQNIVTDDLAPLFPREGRSGANTGGVYAPLLGYAEQQYLRLAYLDDGSLIFTYRGSDGNRHHLRYVHDEKRWYPYEYEVPITTFYTNEGEGGTGVIALGGNTGGGKVYTVGGSTDPVTDDGTGISFLCRPFFDDFDDPRSRKLLGDMVLDADPASITAGLTVNMLTDNGGTTTALSAMTGNGRQQKLYDFGSGAGVRGRNFSLEVSGTTESGKRPRLHMYELALLSRPEKIQLRATDYSDLGTPVEKYVEGLWIEADTFNVAKSLQIEYDGTTGEAVSITHNGRKRTYYRLANPISAKLIRLTGTDTDDWELYDLEWQFTPEITTPAQHFSEAGHAGDKYVLGLWIDADTYGASKVVRIEKDGGTEIGTVTFTHSRRQKVYYQLSAPQSARLLRIRSTDGVAWSLLGAEFHFERTDVPQAAHYHDAGYAGDKYFEGVWIDADTFGIAKSLPIKYDGGTTATTLSVNHSGRRLEYFRFTTPFTARLVKMDGAEIDDWQVMDNIRWDYKKSVKEEKKKYEDGGFLGDKYMLGMWLDADSFGQSKTIRIEHDGGQLGATITFNHSGRRREYYAFPTPFSARLLRIIEDQSIANLAVKWDLIDVEWSYERTQVPMEAQYNNAGYDGDKYIVGVWIDADTFGTNKSLPIKYDGGQSGPTVVVNHSPREMEYYPVTPFTARMVKLDGAEVDDWQVIGVKWEFVRSVKVAASIYTDIGHDGDKFIHGFYIDADTFAQNKQIKIEYDGGTVAETLTINHNGRRREAYAFTTPFTARLVRIVEADSVKWDLLGVDWRMTPEPPAAKVWEIQFTGFGTEEYKFMRSFDAAIASSTDVTIDLYADSDTSAYHTLTFTATGGSSAAKKRIKSLDVKAKKFKLWKARLSSSQPFRLYVKETTALVKTFTGSGDYQRLHPVGDVDGDGARI